LNKRWVWSNHVKQITAYRCCFIQFKACNAKVSYFSAFVASQSPKFFHALLPHVSLSTADPLKFLPHLNLGTATFIIYQNWSKKYQQQRLHLNQLYIFDNEGSLSFYERKIAKCRAHVSAFCWLHTTDK